MALDMTPWWNTNMPRGVRRIELPQLLHPLEPRADFKALKALRALYREIRPDVIHTHQSKAGIVGRLAATAVPEAVVAHGIHIVPFEGVSAAKRAIYIAAERMAARRTDVFIGVSEAVGRAYVSAGITRRGRVHCVRSGMDLQRFEKPDLPKDWRQLLDVPKGFDRPPTILMMAAFEPRKQHVAFLRAFATLVAKRPDLKLLLAGRGPEEQAVRHAVQDLGLQRNVVFTGHRSDPEALFALADLSVLTSEREGLPRVVVQSIAAGCPTLAQALPGLDEVVTHGQNGWISAPADMAGTVQQIDLLLSDPALLSRLSEGAARTDLSAWRLNALGAQTTALYGLPVARPRVAEPMGLLPA